MSVKIESCPTCGKDASLPKLTKKGWIIHCQDMTECRTQTYPQPTEAEAIRHWNMSRHGYGCIGQAMGGIDLLEDYTKVRDEIPPPPESGAH